LHLFIHALECMSLSLILTVELKTFYKEQLEY